MKILGTGSTMRRYVAVLALVAVGLAGCGGSGKSSTKAGDTSPDDKSASTSGDDGGSGGGDSEFSKLLAKTKAAKYKVTYQSGADEAFTIAQDPPRFSYIQGDSATYITEDGSAVSCSGTGSEATCTQLPGSGETLKTSLTTGLGAFAALFLIQAGSGIPGLLDIKTTDKQIAGRDAACATIDSSTLGALGAAIKGSYSVCVDKETGIMLQTKADSGSGSTEDITATDFSEPTDADFTPPATPNTVPGQ
jgi:hypothetical protein